MFINSTVCSIWKLFSDVFPLTPIMTVGVYLPGEIEENDYT